MPTLRTEIEEVLHLFQMPLQEGELWRNRVNQAIREMADVVGHVLDAIDQENQV